MSGWRRIRIPNLLNPERDPRRDIQNLLNAERDPRRDIQNLLNPEPLQRDPRMNLNNLLNPQPPRRDPRMDIMNLVNQLYNFHEEIQNNRIVLYYYGFRIHEARPLIDQLQYISNSIAEEVGRRMQRLQGGYFMVGIVDAQQDGIQLIARAFGVGGRRRWLNADDILREFGESLLQTIENLSQSDRDIDPQDIVVEIMFQPIPGVGRGKKQPCYIRKAIGSDGPTKGLFSYDTNGNNCGFRALVVALVNNGDLRNSYPFDLKFLRNESVNGVIDPQLLRSKKRLNNLADELAEQFGFDSGEWYVYPRPNGTANMDKTTASIIVSKWSKIQIVIFNEVTRKVIDRQQGSEFSVANPLTIFMSYTMEHLQLIKSLYTYFGRTHGSFVYYCHSCLTFYIGDHECVQIEHSCDRCHLTFDDADTLKKHKSTDARDQHYCAKCNKYFYNYNCMAMHFCREIKTKYCDDCHESFTEGHVCQHYKCFYCNTWQKPGHRCLLQTNGKMSKHTAEIEGKNYYAFDVESMLDETTTPGIKLHTVNLVIVRRCFSEEENVFPSFKEFVCWMESLKHQCTFFAHNLKGYDGRLLYEYLADTQKFPNEVLFNGTKIMKMKYGKYEFRDTLTHFSTSLAKLPAMFGLDSTRFKKGWFPYLFNTMENQGYVGPIPDREYFDPQMMNSDQLEKFNKWYDEQDHDSPTWSLSKELKEYCLSDVRILALAIETYMTTMMQRLKYNPLANLTSAGYARSIYGLVFAPANKLYILSVEEYKHIKKAMHGGRTDTRRMIKEWSDEEVANGYYGVYQDVQSLYPCVQYYDPMPVGVPRYKSWSKYFQPTMEEIEKVFGFICLDIDPPDEPLFHPVLVDVNQEGRLVADLNPKTNYVVATPELKVAIECGYKIKQVYWWYDFDQSLDLFKDYISTFIKDKIEASGTPSWVQSDEDWQTFTNELETRIGVKVQKENMVKNAGKKSGAKILLNSLWGKFGERPHYHGYHVTEVGKEDAFMLALEKDWYDGNVDITYRRYNGKRTHLVVAYKSATEEKLTKYNWKNHLRTTNIAVAAMVTSHARMRLWKELNKLGERVLYHDTDSIIYERDPTGYNIPIGKYLGEWEDETGGLPITKFVSTGPKCYSYAIQLPDGQLEEHTKVKGITLTSRNSRVINYESMCKIVRNEMESIEATTLVFKYNRNAGTMTTSNQPKIFKRTCNKGIIDPESWVVYPFGFFPN